MRPTVFFPRYDEAVPMERGRLVELIDRVDIDGLSCRQFNHWAEHVPVIAKRLGSDTFVEESMFPEFGPDRVIERIVRDAVGLKPFRNR